MALVTSASGPCLSYKMRIFLTSNIDCANVLVVVMMHKKI